MPTLPNLTKPDPLKIYAVFNEIGIISQLSGTAFEKVLPHNLTLAQFTVLNHLVRMGDDKTPADIARALQVTRPTLTNTMGKLVNKGMVKLAPSPDDGRSKRVFLTEAGRSAREQCLASAFPLLQDVAGALSLEDVEQVMPILVKLRTWLNKQRNGV